MPGYGRSRETRIRKGSCAPCQARLCQPRRSSSDCLDGEPARERELTHQRDLEEAHGHDQEEWICGLAVFGILERCRIERTVSLPPAEGGLLRWNRVKVRQTNTVVACGDHRKQRQGGDEHGERPA